MSERPLGSIIRSFLLAIARFNLPMNVNLYKIPQSSPDDVSGLDALLQSGAVDPAHIIAILGKTEGNVCVNDFTRGFATQTLKAYLGEKIGVSAAQQIVYIMSGGTEGVLSPHLTKSPSTLAEKPKPPATLAPGYNPPRLHPNLPGEPAPQSG